MQEVEDQEKVAISDDELPPDVDLDDPFFSEELGGSTGQFQIFHFTVICLLFSLSWSVLMSFINLNISCITGTAQKVKKSKKNKKAEEQLTAEEEAELEKRKVYARQ